MEESLQQLSLPALFCCATDSITESSTTCLPVTKDGQDIPNTTLSTSDNIAASYVITGHLFATLRGWTYLSTGYYTLITKEGHGDIRRYKV